MAKQQVIPTAEVFRVLLRYEPESGKLFWRKREAHWFTSGRQTSHHKCKRWNARFEGKEAFTALRENKSKGGAVLGVNYLAHRIIWMIKFGVWPDGEIDHINGDPSDNRIANLRDVTHHENTKNVKRRSDNSSGATGIYLEKRTGKWCARGHHKGEYHYLGSHKNRRDAIRARKQFERKFGFHLNHGRSTDIDHETSSL